MRIMNIIIKNTKTIKILLSFNFNSHKVVVIEYLHDDIRGVVEDSFWLPPDLDGFEDEGLIPGGAQGLEDLLCGLGLVQEGDSSKWI